MTKAIILTVYFFTTHFSLLAQDSTLLENKFVIREYIYPFEKSDLFSDWKKKVKDTVNPTFLKIDLNGDKKLDLVGFFDGIETGLFIFGNIEKQNGELDQLYKLELDTNWFKENKLQAVITLIKANQTILNLETRKTQILSHNSGHIKRSDGSEFVITFLDNKWQYIKIK